MLRHLGSAVAAAVAVALLVGVAVTELASAAIEFSLFVGLPAGAVAGLVAGALVFVGFGSAPETVARRAARAGGRFGVTVLAVFVGGVGLGLRNAQALVLAAVFGAAVATVTWLWPPTET